MFAAMLASMSLPAVIASWYLAPMLFRYRRQHCLRADCASRKCLVLTYDDGPSSLSPRLLDLLESRNARATFFVVGARAAENPALVDRIIEDGHEVACHTHDHLNAWYALPWRGVADVHAGYRSLARWVRHDGLFRPPHGKMTLMTWAALRRRRSPIGWWTIEGGDACERLPSPGIAVERARRAGGGVVLLHDSARGPERDEFVLTCTELLLDAAREEGWAIRTFGELTGEGARHAA